MHRILISMAILLLATSAYAKGVGNEPAIQTVTYADGVLFEVGERDSEIVLSVSGPGNTAFEKQSSSADSVFLSVNNEASGPLRDGLYKYEARAIPAFTISREESSKLRDRNTLNGKTEPKSSPVSGNFRVKNGMVVDANFEEFSVTAVKK